MTDLMNGLGDDVRRAQDALLELRPLPALTRTVRRRAVPLWPMLGSAIAAAALVVVVQRAQPSSAFDSDRPAALFVVDAEGSPSGTTPLAIAGAGAVRASDGSVVLVDEGRATLRELAPDRGFVVLHAGRVSLSLPRAAARAPGWIVEAGPWRVDARGARVDVSFAGDRLTVRVGEGEAHVTSTNEADLDVEEVVRAGEERSWPHAIAALHDAPTASVSRTARAAQTSPDVALYIAKPTVDVPASTDASADTTASADATASDGPDVLVSDGDGPTWQELARDDRHADAMNRARAHVDDILANASVDDVALLATSARLAASADVAKRALVAIRARAPASAQAARAAFFLGVLADRAGDDDGALAFFARYAVEAPNGELASQAMGRALEVGRRAGKDVADDARAYLRRWPDGAHADFASRVLREAKL